MTNTKSHRVRTTIAVVTMAAMATTTWCTISVAPISAGEPTEASVIPTTVPTPAKIIPLKSESSAATLAPATASPIATITAPEAGKAPEKADPAAVVDPGTLFICGGGLLPAEVLMRFVEIAGGANARIVYIPTASMYAEGPELEYRLSFWRALNLKSFDVVHANDRKQADDPALLDKLKAATAVWFGGGVQSRLTDRYLGTAVEREVKNVLRRGGVVGGTSAGAAIMSEVMIRGGMQVPEVGQGFGFVKGAVIDQHFIKRKRHDRLVHAIRNTPQKIGIGIDEGTALIVAGDRLEVIGESRVVVCIAASENPTFNELKAGERGELTRFVAMGKHAEPSPGVKAPAAVAAKSPAPPMTTVTMGEVRGDMPQTGR